MFQEVGEEVERGGAGGGGGKRICFKRWGKHGAKGLGLWLGGRVYGLGADLIWGPGLCL